MSDEPEMQLPFPAKMHLAMRIWGAYVRVTRAVKKTPLPQLTRELGQRETPGRRHSPELLSHAVGRCLRLGRYQARCLVGSLVLYKLLRDQGDAAELVIGLPPNAVDHTAHAWVELAGRDVGPPPGRGRHEALARFP